MAALQDMLHTADVILKFLVPLLALAAGALGVRGSKWDDIRKQPTPVGWWALVVAALTMVASISSGFVSDLATEKKREEAKESADKAQTKALDQQAGRFQGMIDQASTDLKAASAKLAQRQEQIGKQNLTIANSTRLSQMMAEDLWIRFQAKPSTVLRAKALVSQSFLQARGDYLQLIYDGSLLTVNGSEIVSESAVHKFLERIWYEALPGIGIESSNANGEIRPLGISIQYLTLQDTGPEGWQVQAQFKLRGISASFFYKSTVYLDATYPDSNEPGAEENYLPNEITINANGPEFSAHGICRPEWRHPDAFHWRGACQVDLRFLGPGPQLAAGDPTMHPDSY